MIDPHGEPFKLRRGHPILQQHRTRRWRGAWQADPRRSPVRFPAYEAYACPTSRWSPTRCCAGGAVPPHRRRSHAALAAPDAEDTSVDAEAILRRVLAADQLLSHEFDGDPEPLGLAEGGLRLPVSESPVLLDDGRVFGALCGASAERRLGIDEREVRFLRVLAAPIGSLLSSRGPRRPRV